MKKITLQRKLLKARCLFFARRMRFFIWTRIVPKGWRVTVPPTAEMLEKHGRLVHRWCNGDERTYIFRGIEFVVTADREVLPVTY